MSILNKELRPLSGIAPSDLKATVGGKPAVIVSIAPDQRPHRVLILLDSSGSMIGDWQTAIDLAEALFNENGATAQFALMTFSSSITKRITFSDGNAAVRRQLELMASAHYLPNLHGESAIRGAIEDAIKMFDDPTTADAIYVFTDGYDFSSRGNPSYVDALLVNSSLRLFATTFYSMDYGPTPDYPQPGEVAIWAVDPRRQISNWTEDSGGEILRQIRLGPFRTASLAYGTNVEVGLPLDEAVSGFSRASSDGLAMQLQLPTQNRKPVRFRLELSSAARKRWKGAQIIYPRLLAGCSGN